jgi:hypothetical protein
MNYNELPLTFDAVQKLDRVSFADRGRLPGGSGIYFVMYGDPIHRIAYIGKAKNFQQRWVGHHRIPECVLLSKLSVPVEIAWVSVPEEDLESAERQLIATFTPPLNDGPTLATDRVRSIPALRQTHTADDILAEHRARQQGAKEFLASETFWNACNDEDGDLLCVWPFVDGTQLVELDMLWACRDSHDLEPFRVVTPPLFAANKSGVVEPDNDYEVSWVERRDWILRVARQVDSFIFAVAMFHTAALNDEDRRKIFGLLASEPTLESSFRCNPEVLAKLS